MMKNNIFIEFDNSILKKLSEEINKLFNENNYNTRLLDNNTTINDKISVINNQTNSFILSNKVNNDNSDAIEIVYPLRNNDNIAKLLDKNIASIIPVTKYYQLRANDDTSLDYYPILRNINNNNAIIIKYGQNVIDNNLLPNIIYQTINSIFNNSNVYTVKSGDSLYSISKSFNTSVDELKRANNLTSNNLSIGQKLIIPSDNSNNEINNNENYYTVKSGDSLYSISRNFNTSVDELKRVNNLTSNNLSIGQRLIIPNNNNNSNNENYYTVKSGDSLYSISRNFNTSVDELKRANNLTSNNLSIGQRLIIPSNNKSIIYTVVKGDSLYAISKKFNISIDELKRINNLTSNNLSIGQKLIIKK